MTSHETPLRRLGASLFVPFALRGRPRAAAPDLMQVGVVDETARRKNAKNSRCQTDLSPPSSTFVPSSQTFRRACERRRYCRHKFRPCAVDRRNRACRASSRHAAFPSGEAARGRDAPTAGRKDRDVRLSFLRRRRGAAGSSRVGSSRLDSRQAGFGPRRAIQFRIRSWADRCQNAHRAPPRRSIVESTRRHSCVPPQGFDSKTESGVDRPSSKAKGKHRRATYPDKKPLLRVPLTPRRLAAFAACRVPRFATRKVRQAGLVTEDRQATVAR